MNVYEAKQVAHKERLGSKAFRDAYVEKHLHTWIAYQIKTIREQRQWSQAELAQRANKPQSVVSRLENPDYGRFTLRTLMDLASAFDVALLVKFVPFSELAGRNLDLSPAAMQVVEFVHDHGFSGEGRQDVRSGRFPVLGAGA